MELCKSESEEEDLLENELCEMKNHNGIKETTQTCTQDQDKISFQNDKLYNDLCKINSETEMKDHIDTNVQEQNSGRMSEYDLNVKKVTNCNDEQKDVSKMVADENNSQPKTVTESGNEFSNDLPQEENTSAEISLVYNDSVEENQTYVNLENEANETSDVNMKHHVLSKDHLNHELTVENSELNKPDNSHIISLHNDTEKQICAETFAAIIEKPITDEIRPSDEHAFFDDDDVNMEDIDKLIENAEIIQSMYLLFSLLL